jgi:hypothetical protein
VSLPDSSSDRPRGVLVRRPKASIYTALLGIALLALMFSSLLLVLELVRYDFQIKPPANLRSAVSGVVSDLRVA